MSSIPMSSSKTAWKGSLSWSYDGSYVTVTMYTWKTDGYPSSAASGANFTATIAIDGNTKTFHFQQQETDTMQVGTLRAYVSQRQVTISGRVEAPYGVSMYGYPLTGTETVTLYEEEQEEIISPSVLSLSAQSLQMGDTLNIAVVRSSLSAVHKLYYQLTPGIEERTLLAENVLTQYAWVVPDLTDRFTEGLSIGVKLWCLTYDTSGKYQGETWQEITVLVPDATGLAGSDTAVMGSVLNIGLERKGTGFTHRLLYTLNEVTGVIGENVTGTFSWEIPLELAKAIPTLTWGSCTITCVTLHGATEVGTRKKTVALTVPDNEVTKPDLTMVLSPAGNLGASFSGMYIRGRTGVQAAFTGHSDYSGISRYELAVDGGTVTGNPAVSALLNAHGTVTVTGRAVDLRGYVREVTQTIPVIPYDKPRVIPYPGESTLIAVRCNADGTRNVRGQHLLLRAGRKYTALSAADGQKNACTLRYRMKKAGEDAFGSDTVLLAADTAEDYLETVVRNAVPELKTGYVVQLEAVDTLGGSSLVTVPVAGLSVPLHFGAGSGNVSVGKYCDYSRTNAFEIGFTTYFDTGIALQPLFSSGEWAVGTELGTAVPQADGSVLERYTFFLGVCGGEPVWLMKLATGISGTGVRISRDGGSPVLTAAPAPITELYAVL